MYRLVFSLLSQFDPESIHHVVFGGLRRAMALRPLRRASEALLAPRDPALAVEAFGTVFPGPLGLAAGFDKNAEGVDALAALGFAFVEAGTVTHLAQPGNPRPRLFRLKADHALVNRMGFNNRGAAHVAAQLGAAPPDSLLALNIGKTKVVAEADAAADYAASAELLAPYARFMVVNVSSPNTPGLRDLQRAEALAPILKSTREALDRGSRERRVPLLVKIAPDLADDDVDAVADLALRLGLDGIVAANTTIRRDGLRSSAAQVEACGAGGLSGPPVAARSRELLRRLYGRVGHALTLVSVGGIADPEEAWQRIRDGATLLELYTSFVYEGPLVARRIHDGLLTRMKRDGFVRLRDAIGVDAGRDVGAADAALRGAAS